MVRDLLMPGSEAEAPDPHLPGFAFLPFICIRVRALFLFVLVSVLAAWDACLNRRAAAKRSRVNTTRRNICFQPMSEGDHTFLLEKIKNKETDKNEAKKGEEEEEEEEEGNIYQLTAMQEELHSLKEKLEKLESEKSQKHQKWAKMVASLSNLSAANKDLRHQMSKSIALDELVSDNPLLWIIMMRIEGFTDEMKLLTEELQPKDLILSADPYLPEEQTLNPPPFKEAEEEQEKQKKEVEEEKEKLAQHLEMPNEISLNTDTEKKVSETPQEGTVIKSILKAEVTAELKQTCRPGRRVRFQLPEVPGSNQDRRKDNHVGHKNKRRRQKKGVNEHQESNKLENEHPQHKKK
ncbi:neurofilament medium polypeptide-like [Polypterus senegalus]|uniref:neurofilament medium polypeptide-like n=1 Tax=Polypterus senegalus TaxID=55291 RepID=UPI001963BD85|nr:neurofilament medium polypeptide-like [Polypterus senegalus]